MKREDVRKFDSQKINETVTLGTSIKTAKMRLGRIKCLQ